MNRPAVLWSLLVCILLPARAEQVPEYRLKAEFIERFTRFIDWPTDSRPRFVIGVLGRNPFGQHLEAMTTQKIQGRMVSVVELLEPSDMERCHIVFVSASEREGIEKVVHASEGKPILTIGDTPGYARSGVLINFFQAGDRIRFEINEDALEKSGLRASSKLLKLARVVESEER